MKVAFFSNFLTHHQLPFCLELYKYLGKNFRFIATEAIAEEQKSLGYQDFNQQMFVVRAYEDAQQYSEALNWANEADVVIFGSAPFFLVQGRLDANKLTYLYSERIFKRKAKVWKLPVYVYRHYKKYTQHNCFYLLCASAYTSADFAKTFTFRNKAYKWGYFPAVKRYENFNGLMERKQSATILWAGRFIDWKHPEYVVQVAERLRADGYEFHVNMLGNGELQESIAQMIASKGLQDRVSLLGAMSPEEVRKYMEKSQIYLFTSDRQEGWGAVLNESMNSGCAVVASDAIGAVPFLMDNQRNGLIYHSGDVDDLYQKVKYLLDHPEECDRLGTNAYTTMTDTWNAEVAAERLIDLSEKLLHGEKHPYPYTDGPCSKAEIIKG